MQIFVSIKSRKNMSLRSVFIQANESKVKEGGVSRSRIVREIGN